MSLRREMGDQTSVLPEGVVSVVDIIDERHQPGTFVNVIGIVHRALSPMLTKSQQWKADVEIFDISTQFDTELNLVYSIFHSDRDFLSDIECGDVIVVLYAKVQRYGMRLSLLHNYQTSFYLFAADRMPALPGDPSPALRETKLAQKRPLTAPYLKYVTAFFHTVDKGRLPTPQEFNTVKVQSVSIKNKFTELKDVQDSHFYDLKVNVVREPYDSGDKMTLWVSDFTENELFHQFSYDPLADTTSEGQDGDEYGYINKFAPGTGNLTNSWTGPYGRKSLQVTCWGHHGDVIRSLKLGLGAWVQMKNVQVKFGHNGGNLEGFLREDSNARERQRIHPLDLGGQALGIDPQLKEALRRKRDYEKSKRSDLKGIAEAARAGQKRKSLAASQLVAQANAKPENRKKRRAREKMEAAAQQEEQQVVLETKLNPKVKFEEHEREVSSVDDILAEKTMSVVLRKGQEVQVTVPFAPMSYRGNFRVKDFKPDRLEDFAVPKQAIDEYAALSDNDESESESEASSVESGSDAGEGCQFQWAFSLKLEDAEVPEGREKQSFWAMIDNQAAQYLTNLDATNLKRDATTLQKLRDTMFVLWGDLEEQKRPIIDKQEAAAARTRDGKPPESSNDTRGETPLSSISITNRPFGCCILEYGVKEKVSDQSLANAGPGHRWRRMHQLERTRIITD